MPARPASRSHSAPVRGSRPASRAAGHAQALSRGLALLEALAATDHGATLTELAATLELPAPTAHRLLAALERSAFVRQDANGVWTVGMRAFRVGAAFLAQRDLAIEARPHLARLMEQAGETANLAVASDGEAVFIAQAPCRELMRMDVKLGARAPVHASGVGKAMLAALPEGELAAALPAALHRYTEHTLTTREALVAELAASRRRGFAIDDEEHAIGLRCVAAAIHDELGRPWAALSLAGPTSRFTRERIDALGALVRDTAREVSLALGGEPPSQPPRDKPPRSGGTR
jgi:IclR family acetate operon transcriptional repressor